MSAATATESDHLARGIRSLALKHWNDACDELAQAVEHATAQYGDLAPENVEPLILYGKALLGSAIAQSAVLGGAAPGTEEGAANGSSNGAAAGQASGSSSAGTSSAAAPAAAGPSKPNFHFGGDAEDEEDDQEGEGEGAVGEGQGAGGEEDEEGGAAGGDREDDLESAFQVLDMARATLEKEVNAAGESSSPEGAGEDKLKEKKERLAEVHRLLGDVATESEQFDNAVEEYTAALDILTALYASSNRALSELHMLIALALDFVPNANDRAVSHAEKAKKVLLLKLDELEKVKEDERDDKVKREIDDIKGLMGDVDMKIEDLKTVPVAPAPTASDTALEAYLRLQTAAISSSGSGEINDLTSLVKKKKKPVPAPGVVQEEIKPAEENTFVIKKDEDASTTEAVKRKVEEDSEANADAESAQKKAKVEDGAAAATTGEDGAPSAP
ncbi:hypothetical protein JCM10908_001904 [Rhodotorula pacifica]|uniref:Hif1p n=1 Tax=Rhodotorula pacifica TaxID=1495444 RepID=UPI0031716E83